MKFMALISLFLLSQLAFAGQKYEGYLQTENLGFLTLQLDVEFNKGKTSNSVNSYYQEHIDNGQWGDWICENKATFKDSLKIKGTLSTYHGAYIGEISSDRYDLRKGYITLSNVQNSRDEFKCDLLSLNSAKAYFQGYDGMIKVGKFTLNFSIRGTELPAQQSEVAPFVYSLDAVNFKPNLIDWSLNVDHGSYSNNYEWGNFNVY